MLEMEGFKKEYLSKYLEVNVSTLNRWYKLERFPRPSKFRLLVNLLCDDVSEFDSYRQAPLNEKIMFLRYFSGLSLEELSDSIIISRPLLSNWETGNTVPTDTQKERLAMFYDVNGIELELDGPMNSIGSKIRQERLALGLSQADLAKELNLSPATISTYERDLSCIPESTLRLIAEELELSMSYLVGLE